MTGRDREDRARQAAVERPSPARLPGRVVLLRPLPLEQRLGLAVAVLLLPVRADRVAAVVPDHGRGAEAERPAALLEPPADVDVVAGGAELRVEAADRLERRRGGTPCCSRGCARPRGRSSSTWTGPPGAFATQSAIEPSPGGGMFGPADARRASSCTNVARQVRRASADRATRRRRCRRRSRRVAAASPVLRALLRARGSAVLISAERRYSRGDRGGRRRSSRRRRR